MSASRGMAGAEPRRPWPWGLSALAILVVFLALVALAWWSGGAGQLHDPFTYRVGG